MPNIPITRGSLPNWNKQTDAPELFNMFIDKEGVMNFTPSLNLLVSMPESRAIWETPYDGGAYIVVTDNEIYRVKSSGSATLLSEILNTSLPVEMTENARNQVTMVDGKHAYVIDQRAGTVTILTEANGFALTNPGSCCTLNNFTVVLDTDSGIWEISDANNALEYDAVAQILIDPQLEFPLAVRNMNNNLFIFGTAGIERWEPTLNINIYLFPLQKDQNFKVNFGAISTQCIVSNINTIYFLSSRFVVMQITSGGCQNVPLVDPKEDENGIAKTFSEYPDVNQAIGSFYTFRGNYFYQLTFPVSKITWVYSVNSATFANTDDYIIGSAYVTEVVLTRDAVYTLGLLPAVKARRWISDAMQSYPGTQTFRQVCSSAEVRMAQGMDETPAPSEPDLIALSVSLDRETWSNSVSIPIGSIGQRNARTIWRTNLSGQYFTFKLEYYGAYPLTIESFFADIN